MGNAQKLGWAAASMSIGLALGWLVFHHTFPVAEPVVATTRAVVATPTAAPTSARGSAPVVAPAPRPAPENTDRADRLAEIDSELRELPDEDPAALTDLAQEVQSRRLEVEALQEQLEQGDRFFAAEEAPAPAPDTHVYVAAEVARLERQMSQAKDSVRDQQREIRWIAASNDEVRMNAMYAELKRRQSVVNAIQQEINDLFDAEASQAAASSAVASARRMRARNTRNALTERYNEAVAGLAAANAAYQRELANLSEARKTGDALRAEKASLEK